VTVYRKALGIGIPANFLGWSFGVQDRKSYKRGVGGVVSE